MSPTKPPDADEVNIPALWGDPPPPQAANLFVVMARPGEVVLTFGFAAPLLVGTPEQQREQAQKLTDSGMKVTSVTPLVLSDVVAQQLHTVLGQQLAGIAQQRQNP